MLVEVKREILTPHSTISEMFIDGAFECFVLELPVKDGHAGSAIPPNGDTSYIIKLLPSPKFLTSSDVWVQKYAHNIPHILGLPAYRSNILQHWGNWPTDTEGCQLLGRTKGPDCILSSREAFAAAWDKYKTAEMAGDVIQLKVYGGTPSNNHDAIQDAAVGG